MNLRKFQALIARYRDDERGNVTSGVVVGTLGFFLAIGLIVDGGGQVAEHQQAQQIAASAARAGALVAESDWTDPAPTGINAAAATRAAQNYLAYAGVNGTVTVTNGIITVDVDHDYNTLFLNLIGLSRLPANANASAQLIDSGVTP